MPVVPPAQWQQQAAQPPTPVQSNNPAFWQTPQAAYFEPQAGEGTFQRLGKNALLAAMASLFETGGSFCRSWRWPRNAGK